MISALVGSSHTEDRNGKVIERYRFTIYDDGSYALPNETIGGHGGMWYDASTGTRLTWLASDRDDLAFQMEGTAELPFGGDYFEELSTTDGWGSATAAGVKGLAAEGIEVERNADWGWVSKVTTAPRDTKDDGPSEKTVWILDSLERSEVEPIGEVLDDVRADPDFKPSVANAGFEQVGADRIADQFSAQGYQIVAPDGYTPTTGWRRTTDDRLTIQGSVNLKSTMAIYYRNGLNWCMALHTGFFDDSEAPNETTRDRTIDPFIIEGAPILDSRDLTKGPFANGKDSMAVLALGSPASAWMVDKTNHGVSALCSAGPEVLKEWVESWQ